MKGDSLGSGTMNSPNTSACRRCSECPDAVHHWLPVCDSGEEPCWGCKHCDYTCESVTCEACDEEIPIDIAALDTDELVYLCSECLEDKS